MKKIGTLFRGTINLAVDYDLCCVLIIERKYFEIQHNK